MSTPVFTVATDAPFAAIVEELLAHEVNALPVVDEHDHVVGIVSEADLISNAAYGYRRRGKLALLDELLHDRDPQWLRKASGRTAAELMTRNPMTARPSDPLGYVASQMLERRHKCVPVVEDGKLVGVVTRHDLLRRFHRSDAELSVDIHTMLADAWRVPTSHEAIVTVKDGIVTLTGTTLFPQDIGFIEHVIARLPGVVAVENRLTAREHSPK